MTARGPLTAEQLAVLEAAHDVCDRLSAHEEDRKDLIEERDTAWLEAFAAGCSQVEIADGCGCSEILVRQRLGRLRGAAWTLGKRG